MPVAEQLFHEYFRAAKEEEEEYEQLLAIEILEQVQHDSKIRVSVCSIVEFGRILQKNKVPCVHTKRGNFYKVDSDKAGKKINEYGGGWLKGGSISSLLLWEDEIGDRIDLLVSHIRFISFLHFLPANNIQNNVHSPLSHERSTDYDNFGQRFQCLFHGCTLGFSFSFDSI